ncbi:Homeobox protein SIX4 [Thelohanellus kitauei]|uniref:Homeobox protein SIX4 n=1 Tax=Thelohanellus kitauei TaxID=669202 RepID=A0A0C2IHT5_THEKT|nr:Homeobox protein SIX4 [Thelohanellus kitauei]
MFVPWRLEERFYIQSLIEVGFTSGELILWTFIGGMGHLILKESKKNRKLNPVERYRIRKRFPAPYSISNGEKTLYNFLESSIHRLYRVFDKIQYPDLKQKQMLMRETKLSMEQINNWFKNKRQRLKRLTKMDKMK